MGTNYYIVDDLCSHCGHYGKRYHVGKKSVGWVFKLRVQPGHNLRSISAWVMHLANLPDSARLIDEYGDPVDSEKILDLILCPDDEDRREPSAINYNPDRYASADLVDVDFS